MAAKYNLMPNEFIILKETGVAHGGLMAIYTDELMLTNLNIVCTSKGMFGGTKNIFQYPLNQIKRYNGKPQAIMGKLSNGTQCLEVYFMNGSSESFNFQSSNKATINKWIKEINRILVGDSQDDENTQDDDYDPNTLVGAFKEVGSQFKDVGTELLGSLGFNPGRKKSAQVEQGPVKISKKCISCSAPLVGYKGKVIKCRYCDAEQTL